jgi:hypothetical protein
MGGVKEFIDVWEMGSEKSRPLNTKRSADLFCRSAALPASSAPPGMPGAGRALECVRLAAAFALAVLTRLPRPSST